jgi:hypothetical protein
MKLNKETLRRIIKEELNSFLVEARIKPINPMDNVPAGVLKDRMQDLIDAGAEDEIQGYTLAQTLQDPTMGAPYEGDDYVKDKSEYDIESAIQKAYRYFGEFSEALRPSPHNENFNYKHLDKIYNGVIEVDYEEGVGPLSMRINIYFDAGSGLLSGPIELQRLVNPLAFTYLDLKGMPYSTSNTRWADQIFDVGLRKMMISETKRLFFRSKEAAHYFGVRSMDNPNLLGGSKVFMGKGTWHRDGKYDPPNPQEIAQKIKDRTIIIYNQNGK